MASVRSVIEAMRRSEIDVATISLFLVVVDGGKWENWGEGVCYWCLCDFRVVVFGKKLLSRLSSLSLMFAALLRQREE